MHGLIKNPNQINIKCVYIFILQESHTPSFPSSCIKSLALLPFSPSPNLFSPSSCTWRHFVCSFTGLCALWILIVCSEIHRKWAQNYYVAIPLSSLWKEMWGFFLENHSKATLKSKYWNVQMTVHWAYFDWWKWSFMQILLRNILEMKTIINTSATSV